jgi:hypothetical protein
MVVAPPPGAIVASPPPSCSTASAGRATVLDCGRAFYSAVADGHQVIPPPIDAATWTLPEGAVADNIGGMTFIPMAVPIIGRIIAAAASFTKLFRTRPDNVAASPRPRPLGTDSHIEGRGVGVKFLHSLSIRRVALLVITLAVPTLASAPRAQQYPPATGPASASTPPPTLTPGPALAQPPAAPPPLVAVPPPNASFASGLQFIAYPYLWLAGINLGITTPLQRIPQVTASAGAGEVIGDLNNVPFMGAAELRYGPFGVLADAIHFPVGVPITTRNILFSGGSSDAVVSIVTTDFLYRLLDQGVQTVDGGLGFRWWGISTGTVLTGRLLPTESFGRTGSWTDPLIAARYHRVLGNRFGFTAYADVGGFGIAAHADWQIVGTLDYALKSWLDLHLGYRSLNVSYSASDRPIGFNVHLRGPIIGATLRF